MWIKWTEKRMLSIPAGKDKLLTIMPGVQYVEDRYWKLARPCVERKINKKLLVEIKPIVQTGNKGNGGKDMPDTYIGTEFGELSAEEQEILVSECYSLSNLELMRKEGKESLRVIVNNQIDDMNKRPGNKG